MGFSRQLFGGALVSAGIVAAASGQSFNNTPGTFASAYGYDYASYVYLGSYSAGQSTDPTGSGSVTMPDGSTASFAWDAPAGSWSVSLAQSPDVVPPYTAVYASIASIFTVSAAYDLTISWDFSAFEQGPVGPNAAWFLLASSDASFTPDELIDGVDADEAIGTPADGVGPTGTWTVQLQPGIFYQLALDLFAEATPRGATFASSGFINAQLVPAPGGVALVGLAGLAAARRRRR